MPFKSKAQEGFMFAEHPEIAKKWAGEYGETPNLPEHVGDAKAKDYSAAMKRAAEAKKKSK